MTVEVPDALHLVMEGWGCGFFHIYSNVLRLVPCDVTLDVK